MESYYGNVDKVYELTKTRPNGLTDVEVEQRQQQYGKNQLEEDKKKSLGQRIWEQIKDPMIIVLISAALISGAFNEIADMVIILIVVLLNTILGIVQENKAEQAIEALKKMSAPTTRVRRNGMVMDIKSEDLVVGDIVLLEAGTSVPADIRLTETVSLKIEEAALTGESVPVQKDSTVLINEGDEVSLGDRVNMAYMGTSVTYGRGEGIAAGIGMQTEMGKIANILAASHEDKTPLQQKLASLSKVLSISVLSICVFIFVFTIFRDGSFSSHEVLDAFLIAVSLAVAAIPEGLVVVVTVMLSIGVTKMSSRNAVIRRLTAVETLGCAEVICSDKTGTLTQNKMTVTKTYGDEQLLAQAMALCNDSQPDGEGGWIGDPTETALVTFAAKLDVPHDLYPRLAEAPFDSERKMMSVINDLGNNVYRQYTKGAPDVVLNRSTHVYLDGEIQELTAEIREQLLAENHSMADQALRVLGAAYKDIDALPASIIPEEIENNLVFIGLSGMIDPIRPEAKDAITECESAGIQAIMITGDHRDTAIAIAKDLGLLTDASQAITGSELSKLDDAEFEKRVRDIVVYARVQPEHKVRIVAMWKKIGKITAMTGDGVNDAPALKSADIGVGMGITGTDVTKNVADMVLADDNFATIVYAVEEGRRIYENIRKAVQFLLSANLSEVIAIFIATLLGKTLFAPIHILWINLITDTFPAMALGMEESEPDIMQKPPRNPKESIFAGRLGIDIIWQGIIIALLTLAAFFIGLAENQLTGMTMAFLTLSMCEIFHSINMRSRNKSIFKMTTHNKYLFGAMLLSLILTLTVIYIPGLNDVFRLTPLSFANVTESFGIALMIIPIVEVVKAIRNRAGRAI